MGWSKAATAAPWQWSTLEGGLLAAAGDPHYVAYMRSAAKPFQALPTVAAGALDHFGLDDEALALMCASHHGTEAHVAIDQRILDAIGLDKSALRCGVHWPIDEAATRRLAQAGQEPDAASQQLLRETRGDVDPGSPLGLRERRLYLA